MYADNEGPNEREHESWDNPDNGADSWDEQFERVMDEVGEIRGEGFDLRNDEQFLEDYEKAFGLELGDHHLNDYTWENSQEMGRFLADWYDMDHDDIDEFFGYDES